MNRPEICRIPRCGAGGGRELARLEVGGLSLGVRDFANVVLRNLDRLRRPDFQLTTLPLRACGHRRQRRRPRPARVIGPVIARRKAAMRRVCTPAPGGYPAPEADPVPTVGRSARRVWQAGRRCEPGRRRASWRTAVSRCRSKGAIGTVGIVIDVSEDKPVGEGFEAVLGKRMRTTSSSRTEDAQIEVTVPAAGKVTERSAASRISDKQARSLALLWVWNPQGDRAGQMCQKAVRPGDQVESAKTSPPPPCGVGGRADVASTCPACGIFIGRWGLTDRTSDVILHARYVCRAIGGSGLQRRPAEVQQGVISGGCGSWDGGIQTDHMAIRSR